MDNDNIPKASDPDIRPVTPPASGESIKPDAPAPLGPMPAPEPSVTPAPTNLPPKPPVAKKSRKSLIIAVLVALLLAGGAAAYWFVLRDKDDTVQTSVETKEIDQLRIGNIDGPANNLFPKEGIGVSYAQNRQVYEGLVGNDDNDYVPLLATSWTNPDEKTWIFKLKPDVKFHTGKALTATDVKRSIEAMKPLDYIAFITSTIDTVEVVSDLEVKITTTEPDALLLNRLALAYITDQDAADKIGNDGTGPYKLDTAATFDEVTATLIANDEYHGGRPKTRKLVYTIYDSDEKLNSDLKEGKLDIIETIPDDKAIAGLSDAGFAKLEYGSPGTFGMYMNMLREDSPLKKKEVRKALAQAVDRVSLIKDLDNDNIPATQVIPKVLPGYDADLSFPSFDADAARQTLKDAGYPDGVTLEYVYINEVQPDPPIIIKQLEAAGFNIEVKAFDDVDAGLDAVFGGDFDLFSAAFNSDLADSRDLLGAILESKEQAYPVYSDTTYDKLLEDSDQELDPTKRIAILQSANKYITDNYLWIPLRSTAYVAFYKPSIDINVDFPTGGNLGVYYWRVGQKAS